MESTIDELRESRRHGGKDKKEREPGERLSWSEIDKRRNRSPHSEQGLDSRDKQAPKDRYASAQAQKALKGELESLFKDNKGDDLKKSILDAKDRAGVQAAIEAWLDARGELPSDDPLLLEKCLDARKDGTLRLVVAAIAAGMSDFKQGNRKVLLLKLRAKGRRTFDAKLGKEISALVAQWGADD